MKKIELAKYCGDDGDELSRAPFNDGKYSYVTDRSLAIRVPRQAGHRTYQRGGGIMASLPWDHEEISTWVRAPNAIPGEACNTCECCRGAGRIGECPKCRCDLGDTIVCQECDGEGVILNHVPVDIEPLGIRVSNYYLAKLHDLTSLELAYPGEDDIIRLRFLGGLGLLMRMEN